MRRSLISRNIYHRLPESVKVLTENFEDREKDIVLLSSIGVLSNCLPNIYGNYGTEVSPHLYILIIAPPASGKGTMNLSRIIIEKIHEKTYTETRSAYLSCINNNTTEDKSSCPAMKIKILPANISSAEMYKYLESSDDGLLIIESEADTMGQMLKNDWSSYSDILRKAFHHEPLSMSRKSDRLFMEVKNPKLSIVLSGTPEQIKPIIQSRENGLFSRFTIYNFDEVSKFKNIFEIRSIDIKQLFNELADKVFDLYHTLQSFENPIEFELTEKQKNKLHKTFESIHKDVVENHTKSFVPNVNRHALMCFRIAMIFTALRNINSINQNEELICSNVDFMNALNLTKELLKHCQFTFDSLDNGILSIQDESILDNLNSNFKRSDAIEVGNKYEVPARTVDDKLSQWQKKKVIKKIKKGHYKKM